LRRSAIRRLASWSPIIAEYQAVISSEACACSLALIEYI
jgi:hypothetical protein